MATVSVGMPPSWHLYWSGDNRLGKLCPTKQPSLSASTEGRGKSYSLCNPDGLVMESIKGYLLHKTTDLFLRAGPHIHKRLLSSVNGDMPLLLFLYEANHNKYSLTLNQPHLAKHLEF